MSHPRRDVSHRIPSLVRFFFRTRKLNFRVHNIRVVDVRCIKCDALHPMLQDFIKSSKNCNFLIQNTFLTLFISTYSYLRLLQILFKTFKLNSNIFSVYIIKKAYILLTLKVKMGCYSLIVN